jgi:hypothetical protein
MTEQVVWHAERVMLASAAKLVATVRARAWVLGPVLLFGLLGALIATQLQAREWRSRAEVVLRVQPVGPEYWQEQAHIARSPELARRVVLKAGVPNLTAERFLRHSSISPPNDAGTFVALCIDPCPEMATDKILTLSVTYQPRPAAIRLAKTYASEFVDFKRERDARKVEEGLRRLQATIERYRARGAAGSREGSYESLVQYRQQLKALGLELLKATHLSKGAEHVSSFRPHTLRNGLFGGVLGTLLGLALVLELTRRRRQRTSSRRG